MRLGIILASVREGRRGEAFAQWIASLAAPKFPSVEQIDLRDWPLPAYSFAQTTPAAEKAYDAASLHGRWRDKIAALDAFLIVTPEYTHGYPGALKNALDHLYVPWNYKPVAFVSYGGFSAGARAVEQLRLLAVELRMVPIRDEVNLRLIGLQADERGWPKDELYGRRAGVMLDELSWFAGVLSRARPR